MLIIISNCINLQATNQDVFRHCTQSTYTSPSMLKYVARLQGNIPNFFLLTPLIFETEQRMNFML